MRRADGSARRRHLPVTRVVEEVIACRSARVIRTPDEAGDLLAIDNFVDKPVCIGQQESAPAERQYSDAGEPHRRV